MRFAARFKPMLAGSALLAGSLLASCGDDPPTCNDRHCGQALPSIPIVDDAGQPALARGEQRTSQSPTPLSFDCTAALATALPAGQVACQNGLVSPMGEAYPGSDVELRFQRPDGSFSEWQTVAIAYSSHTDPDFNGPGCSCTSYTATVSPVRVPANAQVTSPDTP